MRRREGRNKGPIASAREVGSGGAEGDIQKERRRAERSDYNMASSLGNRRVGISNSLI